MILVGHHLRIGDPARAFGAAPARIIVDNYLSARGSHMEDVFDLFGSINISRTASREQLSVLYDAARCVASGNDLHYRHTVVRATAWGDHPFYALPELDFPTTPAAGGSE